MDTSKIIRGIVNSRGYTITSAITQWDYGYVFTTRLDGRYNNNSFGEVMRDMSKRCDIHIHPHRFRRTLATDLARKGMPIQEIQKLLGHSKISTTQGYIETSTEKVEASYRQYVA